MLYIEKHFNLNIVVLEENCFLKYFDNRLTALKVVRITSKKNV